MSRPLPRPLFERDQSRFEFASLAGIPGAWRGRVARLHERKKAESLAEANLWLCDVAARIQKIRIPLTLTDAELCDLAEKLAGECFSLAEPVAGIWYSVEKLRERMAAFCNRYSIAAPPVTVTDAGAVSRMSNGQWWRRKLRAVQARAVEAEAIQLGYVHRRREVYASDVTVERRRQQKARNKAALEATEALNTVTGEIYTLAQLAGKSVSSPGIRRGELMTRIAGFESVAKGMQHAAEFWTATCPSRMHPKKIGANGAVLGNPKFDGTTPRQAQQYLGKVWARFRAAAARRGLSFYGFRIAEPHHDATPHWHLLLFMPAMLTTGRSAVSRLRSLFRRYFLEDSKTERGAKAARCEFVAIDWARGSAAGYIAKYVSKNIDGYGVQGDFEGENMAAVTGSQRVEAWAAAWGVRQFQQVGGPPIGPWREMRRMAESETHTEKLKEAISAADTANFARYVELQGGPTVSRKGLGFRVAYTRQGERFDAQRNQPFQAPLNRYGETAEAVVFGVLDCVSDRAFLSRFYQWIVRGVHVVGRVVGLCAAAVAGGRVLSGLGADFSRPWSSVNNCTRGEDGNAKDDRGEGPQVESRHHASVEHGAGFTVAGVGAGFVARTSRDCPRHSAGM